MMACGRALVKPGTTPVYYSENSFAYLLPTSAMTDSIDGAQHIDGTFFRNKDSGELDSTSFSGDAWVRANDSVFSMTLFSSLGMQIAELNYERDSVSFSSSFMDAEKVRPEYIVADLQSCFYPFAVLSENFKKSGFVFTEKKPSAGSEQRSDDFERILSENGKVLLRVTRRANEIDLVNEIRHYKYHIILGSD